MVRTKHCPPLALDFRLYHALFVSGWHYQQGSCTNIALGAFLLRDHVVRQLSKYEGKRGSRFKSGNWMQSGGEFLFQDGQAIWCHRMKNYRNHAEIGMIKRVLEIED